MDLASFVEKIYTLAEIRDLSPISAVSMRLKNDGKDFVVCVSWSAPSQTSFPANVLWLNANKNSANFKKLLRRKQSAPGVWDTWLELSDYDQVFAEKVVWVTEDSLREESYPYEPFFPATPTLAGKFVMSQHEAGFVPNGALAIAMRDVRMSDARHPTPHEHPREVARSFANADHTLALDLASEPVAGTLFKALTPDSLGWDTAKTAEIFGYSSRLVSIVLTSSAGDTIVEDGTTDLQVMATYSDTSVFDATNAVEWTYDATVITINNRGIVSGNTSIDATTVVPITAKYKQANTGIEATASFSLTVTDRKYPTAISLITPVTLTDKTSTVLLGEVLFNDATMLLDLSTEITWEIITSPAPAWAVLTDATLALSNVIGDKTLEVSGSYSFNGRTVSANKTFAVLDNDPPLPIGLTITGPATLNGGSNRAYVATAAMSDNTTRTVEATWTVVGNDATIVAGNLTAAAVWLDHTVVLHASYTQDTETVVADFPVSVVAVNVVDHLVVTGGSVNENSVIALTVDVWYDTGLHKPVTTAAWQITTTTGALGSLGAATGIYTAPVNMPQDVVETIVASATVEGVALTTTHALTIVDTTIYPTQLVIAGATTLDGGQTRQYTALGTYSGNTQTAVEPTWSVVGTNATISESGQLVADPVLANHSITIHAHFEQNGQIVDADHVVAVVANNIPDHLVVVGPATVNEGGTASFDSEVWYTNGLHEPIIGETWELTTNGGSLGSVDAATGTYTAPINVWQDTAEEVTARATIKSISLVGSRIVTVIDTTVYPSALTVSGPVTIDGGQSRQFSATATHSGNTEIPVSCVWSLVGTGATISASGVVTADPVWTNHAITIRGTLDSNGVIVTNNFDVEIVANNVPVSMTIVGAATVDEGDSAAFDVDVLYNTGLHRPVAGSVWRVTTAGGALGSVDAATGMYTAPTDMWQDTPETISANLVINGATLTASHALTVIDNTIYPTALTIVGPTALNGGASVTFTATATHSGNTQIPATPVVWSVVGTGVSVTTEGRVSANAVWVDHNFTVNASHTTAGGVTVTTSRVVTVVAHNVPVSMAVLGSSSFNEGTTSPFVAQVTYDTGLTRNVVPSWAVLADTLGVVCGTIDTAGVYTAPTSVWEDTAVTVNATTTVDGVALAADWQFTVVDTTVYPSALTVIGPTTLDGGASVTLTANATHTGNTQIPATLVVWSVVGSTVAIDAATGILAADAVWTNHNVTVSATHTANGQTVTASKVITVVASNVPVSMAVVGPASLNEGSTATLDVAVWYDTGLQRPVAGSVWSVTTAGGAMGSVDAAGVYTAPANLWQDAVEEIQAKLTVDGVALEADHSITVIDTTVYPSALTIVGASSLNGGSSATFAANATHTGNTQIPATPVVWSVVGSTVAIDAATGILAADAVWTNHSVTVSATHTANGQTVTASKVVEVVASNVPVSMAVVGPTSVNEGSTSTLDVAVWYDTGLQRPVAGSVWSVTTAGGAMGSVDAAGVYTAPANLWQDSAEKIHAALTVDGVALAADHNLTVIDSTIYPSALTIVGPTAISAGAGVTFTATATHSGNTQLPATPVVWSVTGTDVAIDAATGALTSTAVLASHNVTVNASHTANGQTVTATRELVIAADNTVDHVSITSPTSLSEGATLQLTATVFYANGLSEPATTGIWAIASTTAIGSLDGDGLYTAPASVAADATEDVAYVLDSVSDTVTITVLDTTVYPSGLRIAGDATVIPAALPVTYALEYSFDDLEWTKNTTYVDDFSMLSCEAGVVPTFVDTTLNALEWNDRANIASAAMELRADMVFEEKQLTFPTAIVTLVDPTNYVVLVQAAAAGSVAATDGVDAGVITDSIVVVRRWGDWGAPDPTEIGRLALSLDTLDSVNQWTTKPVLTDNNDGTFTISGVDPGVANGRVVLTIAYAGAAAQAVEYYITAAGAPVVPVGCRFVGSTVVNANSSAKYRTQRIMSDGSVVDVAFDTVSCVASPDNFAAGQVPVWASQSLTVNDVPGIYRVVQVLGTVGSLDTTLQICVMNTPTPTALVATVGPRTQVSASVDSHPTGITDFAVASCEWVVTNATLNLNRTVQVGEIVVHDNGAGVLTTITTSWIDNTPGIGVVVAGGGAWDIGLVANYGGLSSSPVTLHLV